MNTRRTAILFALLLSATADARTYDLADLDALARQSGWQELLDHADDIAPAQRTAHWSQLVEQAAVGVLAGLDIDKASFTGLGAADDLTRRFPQLNKSTAFMAKRADVGLRAFTRCFELTRRDNIATKACAERLAGFSDGDPDNADLAHRSIALIDGNIHYRSAAAFTIYYRLIKHAAKECSNDAAKWVVIEALALDKTDPRVAQAREVASGTCWDRMKNELVDALTQPHDGAHYFENSCQFLVDKKALATLQTNRCKALPK